MAQIRLPDGNLKETCKICGAASPLFDVVDFSKSCQELESKFFARSGIPIYYNFCPNCGFLFTRAFDSWTNEDFLDTIYNSDYSLVDPDFSDTRPIANAKLVIRMLNKADKSLSILDFGGGNGRFRDAMREGGFENTYSYDPYQAESHWPHATYDLITAFEVIEHAVSPMETLRTMSSLLKPQGIVLFSTLLQPKEIHSIRLNWWYVAPRNGHLSLFSAVALEHAWQKIGYNVRKSKGHLMMAWQDFPSFAHDWMMPN